MAMEERIRLVSGDVLAGGLDDLSVRSRNATSAMGVHTVADLAMRTEGELKMQRGLGAASLIEIRRFLEARGLSLAVSRTQTRTSRWQDLEERVAALEMGRGAGG